MNHEKIEVELLITALKRFDGHDFSGYSVTTLMRRLNRILVKYQLPNISSLIPLVVHDDIFRQSIIDELTINVSSLFRDHDVFLKLRNKVLPYLATFPQLSIWVAGCANGEEAYSMAILLAEAGLLKRTQIYATDINKNVLKHAKSGKLFKTIDSWSRKRYGEITDGDNLQKYFYFENGTSRLKEEYLSKISFECHDIVQQPAFISAQLVMCRNVMIYFEEEFKQRAFDCLNTSLDMDGFMVVGKSESFNPWSNKKQHLIMVGEGVGIYQKKYNDFFS